MRGQGSPHRRRLRGRLRTRAVDRGRRLHRRLRNREGPPGPHALLYADGIHDSLYRSAGRSLTQPGRQSAYAADPLPIVTTGPSPPSGVSAAPIGIMPPGTRFRGTRRSRPPEHPGRPRPGEPATASPERPLHLAPRTRTPQAHHPPACRADLRRPQHTTVIDDDQSLGRPGSTAPSPRPAPCPRPVQPKSLGHLPAARGIRDSSASTAPPGRSHVPGKPDPPAAAACPVAEQRTRRHPLTRQRPHVLIRRNKPECPELTPINIAQLPAPADDQRVNVVTPGVGTAAAVSSEFTEHARAFRDLWGSDSAVFAGRAGIQAFSCVSIDVPPKATFDDIKRWPSVRHHSSPEHHWVAGGSCDPRSSLSSPRPPPPGRTFDWSHGMTTIAVIRCRARARPACDAHPAGDAGPAAVAEGLPTWRCRPLHGHRGDRENARQPILAKLELRDRTQAVVTAYETGLVVPGSRERGLQA